MYQDYFNAVIEYYRTGKKSGNLPQRLMNPTPGNLKEECLSACEERFDKKDIRTLSAFFKIENDQHAMLRVIRRCERDRFKPLVNLLKGLTSKTDHVNIELLAWLIDFPDRPFKEEYVNTIQKEEDVIKNNAELTSTRKMEAPNSNEIILGMEGIKEIKNWRVKPFWVSGSWKKVFSIAAGLLVFTLLSFYLVNRDVPKRTSDTELAKPILGPGDPTTSNNSLAVRNLELIYARCTGSTPCRACSNCSSCNYCNSGGNCGICAATKKAPTQKRAAQCLAMTKKGIQCSRNAQSGGKYCWQHIRYGNP